MIRTSKHTIKYSNLAKKETLSLLLDESSKAINNCIDFLWNNKYVWTSKGKEHILDVQNNQLDCPSYILEYVNDIINLDTNLSARALKCLYTQACSIVRSQLEKPKRRLHVLAKLKAEQNKTKKIYENIKRLEKVIEEQKVIKPIFSKVKAELNSICCDFIETSGEFNGFIQLKSVGKDFGKIRLPIKFHRQSLKWKNQGKIMNSFLISKDHIEIRWKVPNSEKISEGEVVGVDQGYKDIATFSNGLRTPKCDCHNHSLESITKKLARKQKGSKAFEKTQEHRKNFINWDVNQLNLEGIKQINLEEIINIRKGKRTSRLMSHWCNTLIRDKILKSCEEVGVQVHLQSSTYRSQRCFACGWVQKSNRKLKEFKCKKCSFELDADLNASKNHSIELPDVPYFLRIQRLNLKGFFWNLEGFKTLNGEELTVPSSKKKK